MNIEDKELVWLGSEVKTPPFSIVARREAGGGVMDAGKRKRLKEAGWRTGSVAEFLELTPEDSALIEIKLRLAELAKKARARRHLSQMALAQRIGSSQSRVAKIEAGDPSVSLELLVRASLASGATRKELARAIA